MALTDAARLTRTGGSRRRPQWRGDRRAVLVRMALPLARQLEAEAARTGASLSDTAARLIEDALARRCA